MSRLTSLIANLPAFFEKSPLPATALTISKSGGAVFEVKDGYLLSTPVSGTALRLPLRTTTITALVASVNATTGYVATVVAGGTLKAHVLVEGVYDGSGGVTRELSYFTSGTYQTLAPIGVAFDDLDADMVESVGQMDMRQADGVWLDRWAEVFGQVRAARDSDALLGRRITYSVIKTKCNNTALEALLIQALGISNGTVVDSGVATFTVTITLSDSTPGYDTVALRQFIDDYKAWGTVALLAYSTLGQDTYATTTAITETLIDSVDPVPPGEFGGPMWARPEFGGTR